MATTYAIVCGLGRLAEEDRMLTQAERDALVENATMTVQMFWDSLVPESDVPASWDCEANEEWHCLPRAWRCDHDEDEECSCYTDEEREEAEALYARTTRGAYQALRDAQFDRAASIARELRAERADALYERTLDEIVDRCEPGTVLGSPAESRVDNITHHAHRLAEYAVASLSAE